MNNNISHTHSNTSHSTSTTSQYDLEPTAVNTREVTKLRTPEKLVNMTAAVSYCKHTNVKLAISTMFINSATAYKHGLTRLEHPIFGIPLVERYRIYDEVRTPTERYITMVSILVGLGILDTGKTGLFMEAHEVEGLHLHFKQFINLTASLAHDKKKLAEMELPMLRNTMDTMVDAARIKTHLNWCGEIIEAGEAGYFAKRVKQEGHRTGIDIDTMLDLYDAADDERALVALLSAKPTKQVSRNKGKLNGWALRCIKRNTDYTTDQLDFIKYHMHTESSKLLVDNIKQAIKLTKAGLTYEDYEREQALLVIRMLESKLEEVLEVEESFGFVSLDYDESDNSAATIAYKTKTKVVSNLASKGMAALGSKPLDSKPTSMAVAQVQKGSSALGRLLARRKAQ